MFNKILIAVDDSSDSQQAGQAGLIFAKKVGAQVLVCHIVKSETGFMGLKPSPNATLEYVHELLRPWEERGKELKLDLQTQHRTADDVAEGIVVAAGENECGLIVMGTHGREGLQRLLLGSVAERVSRLAPMPVMLVRGEASTQGFNHILAPVDGSEAGKPALALADELAGTLGAELRLLTVIPYIQPITYLDPTGLASSAQYLEYDTTLQAQSERFRSALKEASKSVQSPHQTELVKAFQQSEAQVIVEYAQAHPCDLIVMGTHGHTGLERVLLGSVAEGVTHHATVPVLLSSRKV